MKETKRALIVSGFSLIVSLILIMGTTFAWFTDTVVNKDNTIVSGELTANFLMGGKGDDGKYHYTSITGEDKNGSIFNDAEGKNGHNWEPSRTEVVYLAVRNDGSLDLKYNIDMDITGELAGSLEYALIDEASHDSLKGKTWADIKNLSQGQSGNAGENIRFANYKNIKAMTSDEDISYFALAIHMKEDAPNDVQGKSANINIEVKATQIGQETGN